MAELVNNKDGTHTVNVPIRIPDAALKAGGIEMFAGAYGWESEIPDEEKVNEDGTPKLVKNPLPALDRAVQVIQSFVGEVFKGQIIKRAKEQAAEVAEAQANALLGG